MLLATTNGLRQNPHNPPCIPSSLIHLIEYIALGSLLLTPAAEKKRFKKERKGKKEGKKRKKLVAG